MTGRLTRAALAIALAFVFVTTLVRPVSAQLFGGIVYDPTNYANAVLRYQQLQQQLSQLITTYRQIRTQYLLLEYQARRLPFNLLDRYLALRTPWRPLTGTSTYGETLPWLNAANTGEAAAVAFARATEQLAGYGGSVSTLPVAQAQRIRDRVDRAQLQDGAVTTALEAIGRLRIHEGSVETTLRTLERDTYSNSDDLHTQVAVLNKINVAGVTAARMTKDTNYLLVSLLEQQLLEATERREATVQALNAHAAFLAEARPIAEASTAGTTRALTTFRIP
jgi:hypothetical protein